MPNLVHDYARLINQAIVELPGATDAGIRQMLFEVFHEFFTETDSWQEEISVSILVDTKTPYRLVIAEGGEFVRLLGIVNTRGTSQPAVADMVGVVTLRDTPSVADTWTATVSKTVGIPVDRAGAPLVPDWVVSRWEPELIAGLLGRMMMQSKKPFSNMALAKYHLQRFRNGLGRVKSAVLHGNLKGANTWRYPTAFSTRSQRSGIGGTDTSFGST